jgi:hypothetical protein
MRKQWNLPVEMRNFQTVGRAKVLRNECVEEMAQRLSILREGENRRV